VSASHRTGPLVRHEQIHISEKSGWTKLPMIFGVVGIAGLGAAFATQGSDPQKFWFSYLTAAMYALSLGLGGLFFVLIQHATRAGWSIVVRRLAENMALALPVVAVLTLIGVLVGMHDLYEWSHEEVMATDVMLAAKEPYLNAGSFTTRGIVYALIWTGLALMLWRWSTTQDKTADPAPLQHKMRWIAPLGLILFGFSLTFAAFDWLMSLDPHWFSTIFGVYYFAGCVASTHAFLALVIILLHRSGYLRGVVTTEHFHDLGKMMFAFTVFWAYIGFSQYFLIWYASIPEETFWFSYRGQGDFLVLSLLLIFMRFVIPFIGLMSRKIKRNPKTLAFWCVWILVGQFIDQYWLVQPMLAHLRGVTDIQIDLFDVATLVGFVGVFLAIFTWALSRNALVPVKDARLEESITFENF
jgi:hypothetical protein